MTVAYLVIAHEDAAQLRALLRTLDHEGAVVALVLDAASPRDFRRAAREALASMEKARALALPARDIVWGGYSLALAYLDGMRALLEYDARWTYFVPLSGRCLPTQPHEALVSFLRERNGTNFAECKSLLTDEPRHLDRLDRFHFPLVLPGYRTTVHTRFARALPEDFAPHKGSAWTMLHRDFCAYATTSTLGRRIAKHLRWSFVADELFVPSLLMSGPFVSSVENDARRYIDFPEGARHPRVLTMADLHALRDERVFFARKFDRRVDGEVIDAVVASLR